MAGPVSSERAAKTRQAGEKASRNARKAPSNVVNPEARAPAVAHTIDVLRKLLFATAARKGARNKRQQTQVQAQRHAATNWQGVILRSNAASATNG